MTSIRTCTASTLSILMLSAAFAGLFSLTTEQLIAVHSECSDGIDNDHNGEYDYPQDEGCTSLDDDYEGVSLSGNFVTVTDGREQVGPGDAVTYIVTLKQQRETARDMTVDLHLPAQANIVSASDGGSVQAGHVRWTNVSVYENATRTLQVHVNIRPDAEEGQYLVARATVEGGAEATDTTLIQSTVQRSQNKFIVTITDGVEYVLPGQGLLYTVRVRNNAEYAVTTDVRATFHPDVLINTISHGGKKGTSQSVVWKDVPFAPGQERSFSVDTHLIERAHDRVAITARASAGAVNDTDRTIVRLGLPDDALSISMTDFRQEAEIGQVLTYTIHVKNDAKHIGSAINVDANLPQYGEFVSASEGGYYDGAGNVRWLLIGIAPHGERTLQYSVRVREDAPIGSVLTVGAVTDGAHGRAVAKDRTTVVHESIEIGYVEPEFLFRKIADRAEAMPGGVIRYTISVRNTLPHVVSDAVVVDKFDGRYLSLDQYDRASLISVGSDRMEWKVPVLKPGETWTTAYTLNVDASAPHGLPLENVATLRGVDVQSASLTERVWTGKAGVITQFPQTGGRWDVYLLLFLGLIALCSTGVEAGLRRLVRV